MQGLRTWIEIDKKALNHNLKEFLNLIPKQTRFMAVIKSNAYGHGLAQVAKLLAESRIWNLEYSLALILSLKGFVFAAMASKILYLFWAQPCPRESKRQRKTT